MDKKIKLVPTFFKIGVMEADARDKENPYITARVNRVYDDNIKRQLLEKKKEEQVLGIGSVFSVYLKNPGQSEKTACEYRTTGEEKQSIVFELPEKEGNNRVLYMRLLEIGEAASAYREKSFAEVVFLSKKDSAYKKETNKGTFKCLKKYYMGEWEEKYKYLFIEDREANQKYAFQCWIDELPVPGETEGIYAYVDGSSEKKLGKAGEEGYGAGYVLNCGKDVYAGHTGGADTGANVTGEYIAATNTFKYFPVQTEKIELLRIFYDNNNIGYVPTGIFNPQNELADNYKNAIKAFQEKHPETVIEFVHVDGHSKIYGNEMADRMASDIEQLANRDSICPADGSFSEPLEYVRRYMDKGHQDIQNGKDMDCA